MMSEFPVSNDKNEILEIKDPIDRSEPIIDVNRINLSEFPIPGVRQKLPRRNISEIDIELNINYDDLCGPWIYPDNPVYGPRVYSPISNLCTWKFATENDLLYLRKYQRNKEAILSFFENKLLNNGESERERNDTFVKILWEVFKFTRDHSFTEKGISATLGVMYLTHTYFLSHPWRTAKEVYEFFYETILLHAVTDPPKCSEVFTVHECKLLLELFHTVYMENLVLLCIVCYPNYRLSMTLCNPTTETVEIENANKSKE